MIGVIDSKLRFSSNLNARTNTNMAVLHHADASNCTVEDVHRWHLNKGWAGIGYHYFIRKDGRIFKGRPENTVGAHTLGYNGVSIGICVEGKYEVETMPEPQKQAVIALCKDIKTRLGVTTFKGHRELMATACPGRNYPLSDIRTQINTTEQYHVVQKGETLWKISSIYGVSVQYLVNLNGIQNPSLIQIGQRIKIK